MFPSAYCGHFVAFVLTASSWTSATLTQQNATICNWAQVRAGVIRDAVYLDGGEMWWKVGFADGDTNLVTNNGNQEGLMYHLNYSRPFRTSTTNLTGLFESESKTGGNSNNISPNYIDGTIFANDDELYMYGGLLRLTDAYTPPAADAVVGYEAYQYGPHRQSWDPGFIQSALPEGVTRYVTNGAGVNVPSENLGFYFSGMRGAEWGPIYKDDQSANNSANTLIEVDMSTMRAEKWTNHTLPGNISPRANAQLVWIPVSEQGALVAIGGVNPPEEIFATGLNVSQTAQSKAISPSFMASLPVFDVAAGTWYLQNTTGDTPPQLTSFCSVVASATDGSSYNVYIYGGYDGLDAVDLPSDDVWVLSIPSFTWIKVYSGTASHGRSGHICTMPYPDKMFVIGGMHQDPTQCVDGIIQVFDLNQLKFEDVYTPTVWSKYKVHSTISNVIGGDEDGDATKTASWSSSALSVLFSTRYSKTIKKYYPYKPDYGSTEGTPNSSPTKKNGFPKWAAIMLAVVLGIFLIAIILCIILLLRRHKLLRRRSVTASSASGNHSTRIMRWVNGQPMTEAPRKATSSSIYSKEEAGSACECSDGPHLTHPHSPPAEAGGSQRYEMPSNIAPMKPPVEMATDYNNHENWSQSDSPKVGIARGSSLAAEDQEQLEPGPSGQRNASWISSMGPTTVGGYSSSDDSNKRVPAAYPPVPSRFSSSDDSSNRLSAVYPQQPSRFSSSDGSSKRVSAIYPPGTDMNKKSGANQHDDNWPLVSPIEENLYKYR